MVAWFMTVVTLGALLASVQTSEVPIRSGPADLVFPRPGVAISLEQIEERTHKGADGTSKVEVIRSKVYRDSSGRLRIDSQYGSGAVADSYGVIIEPSTGLKMVLLKGSNLAYRMVGPRMGESGFAMGFAGVGEGLSPSHNWSTRSEELGKRLITGIECEGRRVVQTAEDSTNVTNTIEQWYSKKLELIGFASAHGPHGSHIAHIENVRFENPDPMLFVLPSNYKVVDLELPPVGEQ
jgi:hypothetical protein